MKFRARPSLGGHGVQIKSSLEPLKCVYAGELGGRGPGKRMVTECLFCARHCASSFTFLFPFSLGGRCYYHSHFTNEQAGCEAEPPAETPRQWQGSCSKPSLQTRKLFLFSAACCPCVEVNVQPGCSWCLEVKHL